MVIFGAILIAAGGAILFTLKVCATKNEPLYFEAQKKPRLS